MVGCGKSNVNFIKKNVVSISWLRICYQTKKNIRVYLRKFGISRIDDILIFAVKIVIRLNELLWGFVNCFQAPKSSRRSPGRWRSPRALSGLGMRTPTMRTTMTTTSSLRTSPVCGWTSPTSKEQGQKSTEERGSHNEWVKRHELRKSIRVAEERRCIIIKIFNITSCFYLRQEMIDNIYLFLTYNIQYFDFTKK